jgi:hypothetical protein
MPSTLYNGKRFIQTVHEIQCMHCKEKLRSVHRHDFKMCSCNKVGIDGGAEAGNRILGALEDFEDLGRWRTESKPYEWILGAQLQEHWKELREKKKLEEAKKQEDLSEDLFQKALAVISAKK